MNELIVKKLSHRYPFRKSINLVIHRSEERRKKLKQQLNFNSQIIMTSSKNQMNQLIITKNQKKKSLNESKKETQYPSLSQSIRNTTMQQYKKNYSPQHKIQTAPNIISKSQVIPLISSKILIYQSEQLFQRQKLIKKCLREHKKRINLFNNQRQRYSSDFRKNTFIKQEELQKKRSFQDFSPWITKKDIFNDTIKSKVDLELAKRQTRHKAFWRKN